MRVNPKLRVGLLIGAAALTLVAVRWAGTLSELPEASAGATAEPVQRTRPAAEATTQRTRPATEAATVQRARPTTGTATTQRARPATETTTTQRAPALDLQKLQRAPALDPDGDPFGPRSFRPAPPKIKAPTAAEAAALAAAQPAPPPPMAPPLPFVYMGRLAEEQNTTVFLVMGDRNLVVKPGDVIDNTYKIEEVGESAMVLTYLPMNQRQTLPIGTP
jgi:hypothetical protein